MPESADQESAYPKVTVRKEPYINGELANLVKAILLKGVQSVIERQGPPSASGFRPLLLPDGSVLLIATLQESPESEKEVAGSLALIPLTAGSPPTAKLPPDMKAGEIKRMVVLEAFRRHGVAMKLLETVEEIAKKEMDLDLLVLETWHDKYFLPARKLYEKAGFRRREAYGGYVEKESPCYEKQVINAGM
jgi:GNAT superfamily N-acetyltransferase